jgi:hypothetical protein
MPLLFELTPDIRMLPLSTVVGSLVARLIIAMRSYVPFGVVDRMGFSYPLLE